MAASGPPPWTILAEVEGTAPEDMRAVVRSLLAGAIDASGALSTLPQSQVERGLAEAMRPDAARLTVPVARELAERGGIGTVFAPVLDQIGSSYALTVRVLHAQRDSVLDAERVNADDDDALLSASQELVEQLTSSVRLVAWTAPEATRLRIREMITPSMAAYRLAEEARRANAVYRFQNAIQLYERALEIDPDFAYAWSALATVYANMGNRALEDDALREALKRPNRMSAYDIGYAQARLAHDRFAELRFRERQYEQSGFPSGFYSVALSRVDRFEEALAIVEERAKLDPFGLSPIQAQNRVVWLLVLGRVEEAERATESLASTPFNLPLRARIAAHQGEWAEAERLAMEVVRDPTTSVTYQSSSAELLGSVRSARGRIRSAFPALAEKLRVDDEAGRRQEYPVAHLDALTLAVVSGLEPQAWPLDGLRADTTEQARVLAALWAAELGDTALARSYLITLPPSDVSEFGRVSPVESLVALLNARLASLRDDWEAAVNWLQPVTGDRAPLSDGRNQLTHWVLADAEERLGNLKNAADLFARIGSGEVFGEYDHRSIGLTHSFAHRRAALLYGQLDDRDKAIEHWRVFLNDFTEPDPEFEWMVDEGREELARLEG